MERSRKRKLQPPKPSPAKSEIVEKKDNAASESMNEPYPTHPRPSPEECRAVRDDLLVLNGFPPEFAKYRSKKWKNNPTSSPDAAGSSPSPPSPSLSLPSVKSEPREDGEDETETVLDGLISILLSQNTTDANSTRAFASLKRAFPTWEDVHGAESKCIENAIKCGGLAGRKASCIKNLLKALLEKNGKICLEYLRDMSVDEIKAELCRYKGIGPKTVACVLMFHLQQDDFPVDTHVFRITKTMGWVPVQADREKAYLHLNKRIPNELKFDLNCLFVSHGKLCHMCGKKGLLNQQRTSCDQPCPLSKYYCSTDFK
ncbi:putative DNA glycosylase At3g47830 [Telopea speciosissima]|uniref:putative DNA glycosylase At3g47830 n=1 Tax=Telopea speciosissima TaxID=54955 RepID=UPI001CC6707A|nr:putative DNA glycosylase At3g47830 [Telopea speciosissima]XP_043703440.1 putative DNA glycosylase At3g47830 [Telopea speciosissima]